MANLEEVIIEEEIARRKARTNLKDFTSYTTTNFDWQPYHRVYYEILDRFAKGKIKKLMVSMPPQHGKVKVAQGGCLLYVWY
jgi:hypothetical protein